MAGSSSSTSSAPLKFLANFDLKPFDLGREWSRGGCGKGCRWLMGEFGLKNGRSDWKPLQVETGLAACG
ncbi:hypothetical protein FF1_025318 [Malus domestica]